MIIRDILRCRLSLIYLQQMTNVQMKDKPRFASRFWLKPSCLVVHGDELVALSLVDQLMVELSSLNVSHLTPQGEF